MMALQLFLFCLLFTVLVRTVFLGCAVNGLCFYPKPVQERGILTLIWVAGAAIVAGIVVLVF